MTKYNGAKIDKFLKDFNRAIQPSFLQELITGVLMLLVIILIIFACNSLEAKTSNCINEIDCAAYNQAHDRLTKPRLLYDDPELLKITNCKIVDINTTICIFQKGLLLQIDRHLYYYTATSCALSTLCKKYL